MNNGYCEHGKYVGGCGVDHICGYCEDGISARELAAERRDTIRRGLQRIIGLVKLSAASPEMSNQQRAAFFSCLPHTRACEQVVRRFGGLPHFSLGDTDGNVSDYRHFAY